MSTFTISFDMNQPLSDKLVSAAASTAKKKAWEYIPPDDPAKKKKLQSIDDKQPWPTDDEIAKRWSILEQEHNMLMLTRICRERVRGAADREELRSTLMIKLVAARCNTPAAYALTLLDSEDGAKGRGEAHRRITNMARTEARSLITHRDREVCSDFTEVQRQAVTSAFKADGPWGKLDWDSRSFINQTLASRSGGSLNQEWSDMEFRRGAERINDMTGPAWTRLHKENTLSNMLTDMLRVRDLHDYGRLDRVDAAALSDWYHRFTNMEIGTVLEHMESLTTKEAAFYRMVFKRAARFRTLKVRAWANFLLTQTRATTVTYNRLALRDIVRGEVTSFGTLVAACTYGTEERQQKRSRHSDVATTTEEYMQIRWSTVCTMLGLDPASNTKEKLDKLVRCMATVAGASESSFSEGPCRSQLGRFGGWTTKMPYRSDIDPGLANIYVTGGYRLPLAVASPAMVSMNGGR